MSTRRPWWKRAVKACLPEPVLAFYVERRHQAAVAAAVQTFGHGARPTLPERSLEALLAGPDTTEIRLPAAAVARADPWAMPLGELAALAAICVRTRPRRIFEIGTYTGLATLTMALNAPEAEVLTLDLAPQARAGHAHGLGVGGFPDFVVGAHFQGHPAAARIRQLYADARTLDPATLGEAMDLVVIDGDHTYEFVRADTEHALAMLRPGGLVVWDDYVWTERAPECAGVTRCVNEIAAGRAVHRIAGTRLAVLVDRRR